MCGVREGDTAHGGEPGSFEFQSRARESVERALFAAVLLFVHLDSGTFRFQQVIERLHSGSIVTDVNGRPQERHSRQDSDHNM